MRELICESWPQPTIWSVRQGIRTADREDLREVNGLSNARLPDRGQIIAADVWDAYGDRHDLVRGWVDLVADR